jgi:hypothetical protein
MKHDKPLRSVFDGDRYCGADDRGAGVADAVIGSQIRT